MANQNIDPTFFFLNKIDGLRDPVRNTRWRLLIPQSVFQASGLEVTNGNDFGTGSDVNGTDDFALHIKTCDIPDIELKFENHFYMGFGSAYPVNADISANLDFESILLEDMRSYEAMLAWEQACLNTGILSSDEKSSLKNRMTDEGQLELGLGQHKDEQNNAFGTGVLNVIRNTDVKVELYNWMRGDRILILKLINAFPTKVNGPKAFAQGTNAKLQKFNFTLHCDRWSLFIPKDYAAGFKA